jgi:hypothetical protein
MPLKRNIYVDSGEDGHPDMWDGSAYTEIINDCYIASLNAYYRYTQNDGHIWRWALGDAGFVLDQDRAATQPGALRHIGTTLYNAVYESDNVYVYTLPDGGAWASSGAMAVTHYASNRVMDVFKLGATIYVVLLFNKQYSFTAPSTLTLVSSLSGVSSPTRGFVYNNLYYWLADSGGGVYCWYAYNGTTTTLMSTTNATIAGGVHWSGAVGCTTSAWAISLCYDAGGVVFWLISNIETGEVSYTSTPSAYIGYHPMGMLGNEYNNIPYVLSNSVMYATSPRGLRKIYDLKSRSLAITNSYVCYDLIFTNPNNLTGSVLSKLLQHVRGNTMVYYSTDGQTEYTKTFTVEDYLLTSQQLIGDKIAFTEEGGAVPDADEVPTLYNDVPWEDDFSDEVADDAPAGWEWSHSYF